MTRVALLLLLACSLAAAAPSAPPGSPAWAEGADVTEHLGAKVPLDLVFTSSTGAPVPLRSLFDGVHPVLLVLAYYECPQLCSLVLDGAAAAMRQLDGWGWRLGPQYRVATISFDARERIDQAARKQTSVLAALGRTDRTAWPFLVGDEANITALTTDLGFKFLRDPRTGTLAHTAVVFVLSPDGMISRYLYGTDYPARDLKLALLEASDGKTGSIGDKILLRCFHYDPASRRYGLFISRFMKIGGALIFVIAAGLIFAFARHERRRERHVT
ncbi:MAG: SCO family protein [Kofleriaceae bacterium]